MTQKEYNSTAKFIPLDQLSLDDLTPIEETSLVSSKDGN